MANHATSTALLPSLSMSKPEVVSEYAVTEYFSPVPPDVPLPVAADTITWNALLGNATANVTPVAMASVEMEPVFPHFMISPPGNVIVPVEDCVELPVPAEAQLDELEVRLAAKKSEVNQIAQVVGKPTIEGPKRLVAQLVDETGPNSVPNSPATIARAIRGRLAR